MNSWEELLRYLQEYGQEAIRVLIILVVVGFLLYRLVKTKKAQDSSRKPQAPKPRPRLFPQLGQDADAADYGFQDAPPASIPTPGPQMPPPGPQPDADLQRLRMRRGRSYSPDHPGLQPPREEGVSAGCLVVLLVIGGLLFWLWFAFGPQIKRLFE